MQDNRLSSLRKLYVACQTSIQKMILIYFRPPSYLPCYKLKILDRERLSDSGSLTSDTAASFMQQNGLNSVEW